MTSNNETWRIGGISSPDFHWGYIANRPGVVHECGTCGVVLLTGEKSGFCCGPKGNRFHLIPPLPPLPVEYEDIINDERISQLSRQLNLIFSFAALESSHTFPTPGNPSFVAISGRIFHRVRNNPRVNSAIRWLLYDGFALSSAPHNSDAIPQQWINLIRSCLLRINPLTKQLWFLRDLQLTDPVNFANASVVIHDTGTSEIAAIMCYDNTTASEISPRSLIVSRKNGNDQYIPTISRLWEPLAYPLFFPSGTAGWGLIDMPNDTSGQYQRGDFDAPTTQIWLYRARLLREPRFNIFGRLTNEYVVDMFTRELECRLRYIRSNQSRLRSLEADAALMGEDVIEESENIYLPASFLGSRLWVSNQIADSLAIAAAYGPPTFFITFMCNSNWPEIQSQLRPGQNFTDVPVVVCRVFKRKFSALMSTLKKMFPNVGRPLYSISSIEFQKRGLPHVHILLKYPRECLTPEDIDQVISATVLTDKEDAEIVSKFMVHQSHPEGVINHIPPDAEHPLKYCEKWKDNARICCFGYPKPITPETTIDGSGRIQYARHCQDDRNIVPHCLPLLRKFKSHMNVEIGGSGHLFQYLFKYIHKGPDRAYFRISTDNQHDQIDEIEEFWNGRYHSATEATWRILGYSITKKTPSVTSLPVHLPNPIYNRKYATRRGTGSLSSLERYFLRPHGTFTIDGSVQTFSDLRYSDYFRFFRLQSYDAVNALEHPEWFSEQVCPTPNIPRMHVILRSRKKAHLTRLQPIRLSLGDVFYLRALLQTLPARSFEDLRTVDGRICSSFQEAAIALNLFSDETEAEYCLTEAVESLRTPYQLRLLFIHLLTNDCIASPLTIWDKFCNALSEDFYHSNRQTWSLAFSSSLLQISTNLREHGKTPEDYGLPHPGLSGNEVAADLQRWSSQIPHLLSAVQHALTMFTPEQRQIFDSVCNAIEFNLPLRLFIDGKAGRGKTFLVNMLCSQVRGHGGIVLATATTGFAAQLYPGGRTTHSTFKVPVNERNEMLESPISETDSRAELIRQCSLIIWDEAPMANRTVLTCIEQTCRRVMQSLLPFGGKVVLLLGDFRQTCPVIRNGTRAQIVDACISRSETWPMFTIHCLTTPIRNAEDPVFAAFVDAIGDGHGPKISFQGLHHARSKSDLARVIFPDDIIIDPTLCLQRSILAPTNSLVDSYNSMILDRLPGRQTLFYATDSLEEHTNVLGDSDGVLLPEPDAILDYVSKVRQNGMPDHALRIKLGGVYRLLRNFSIDRGLVKNTRVVITGIGRKLIAVRRLTPSGSGAFPDNNDILLPRITFKEVLYSGHTLLRKQFPLAAAYASTFHSCQGLTLDRVGIDLTQPVFTHGQLYTALSRVRNRSNLTILLPDGQRTTPNITYPEILI